jgi:hypothetical protein
MEFCSATKKNEILSFSGKRTELENALSEISLKSPQITCSPSYADYRPKTNAVILLDTRHRLRGTHARRNREREGNQKFECG